MENENRCLVLICARSGEIVSISGKCSTIEVNLNAVNSSEELRDSVNSILHLLDWTIDERLV